MTMNTFNIGTLVKIVEGPMKGTTCVVIGYGGESKFASLWWRKTQSSNKRKLLRVTTIRVLIGKKPNII